MLVERQADRLRHLSAARIEPIGAGVEGLLHRLAALAARAEGIDPHPLDVPDPRAWGDVVEVLGMAIVDAVRRSPNPDVESRAHAALTELRGMLP